MENMKPKIFWKDKQEFLKQVAIWNQEKLDKAKSILIDTEIKMKTKLNNYNNTLIKTIDVIGRETNLKYNTPLFFIYSNGKVEKKIIFLYKEK